MVFSSISFLFFFLPAVLLFYFTIPRWRNSVLLFASLCFYLWGEGLFLLVMLLSIVTNFTCGRLMVNKGRLRKNARFILLVALVINFSMLGIFKYSFFLAENINQLLGSINFPLIVMESFHLPLGISFFTFQAVSYLIDIYRGEVEPQKNIVNLALYISLFPQLIAGPIVRYKDVAAAIVARKFSLENVADGIRLFLYGLSKKVLLANPLALAADTFFSLPPSGLNGSLAWLGAICFTLQIYFDFSGYTDMAIGLGRMFGFSFPQNFNYPYIATSIRDFWRRWHISLSLWFRDYLYIPMGGSRKGGWRTGRNLLVVFFLCGLWHGASWTFICWGLYHGFFLVVERTAAGRLQEKCWNPVRHFFTMVVVIVGWVIFKCETAVSCLAYLSAMFSVSGFYDNDLMLLYMDKKLALELSVAAVLSTPVTVIAKERFLDWHQSSVWLTNSRAAFIEGIFEVLRLLFLVLLGYGTVISLAAGAYNPFIYFRF